MKNRDFLVLADLLCSEYGWTLDYCLSLPLDVVMSLGEIIQRRKTEEMEVWSQIITLCVNCGFSGKTEPIQKLFKKENKEINRDDWKPHLFQMWVNKGKDPAEFEKIWESGQEIKL